ncbi:hypothetical protein LR48_Vigan01g280000 [Vigna angularis]|uniref:Uncharacterized protein n=1 Tax=Phaseolus angularis TaxID=3914 RepID=A0A0L9TSU6_PHAAN|nr:hypothetical protein LR48_Vigan01g280000 [Vigna angularis]
MNNGVRQESSVLLDLASHVNRFAFDHFRTDTAVQSSFLRFNGGAGAKRGVSLRVGAAGVRVRNILSEFNRAIRFHCEKIPIGFASLRVAEGDGVVVVVVAVTGTGMEVGLEWMSVAGWRMRGFAGMAWGCGGHFRLGRRRAAGRRKRPWVSLWSGAEKNGKILLLLLQSTRQITRAAASINTSDNTSNAACHVKHTVTPFDSI